MIMQVHIQPLDQCHRDTTASFLLGRASDSIEFALQYADKHFVPKGTKNIVKRTRAVYMLQSIDRFIKHLVQQPMFDRAVMSLIIVNTVFYIYESSGRDMSFEAEFRYIKPSFEITKIAYFCEIVLRMIAKGPITYLRYERWSGVDVVLVVMMLPSYIPQTSWKAWLKHTGQLPAIFRVFLMLGSRLFS